MIEQLHYLSSLTLSMLEDVILDSDAKVGERLKAGSLVMDMVKATAPAKAEKFADEALEGMNDEELDAYIKKLR